MVACSGALEAGRAVCNEIVHSAFALTRPPGHHAHCGKITGFCFLNNAAIVAKNMQKEYGEKGVKKVVVFDWDIHVGDGTSQILENDDSVLYVSIHRAGDFYPFDEADQSTSKIGKN
jgi:histone deacetylase 6